ncbi:MAG TPA: glycosyltransferase [Planctomycetota bacterium]|nr:glycosyltransferase [Planctomycetota bacterium]
MASDTQVSQVTALRAELGLPAHGRLVLCRGGFGAERPLELLLAAAPFVLDVCPTVHFVVLGDGPRRTAVESETRKRLLDATVIFTGPVSASDSEKFAIASDLGLYLTQSVGSSLPSFSVEEIFDFLRAGRPVVVASDNPDAVCFTQVNNIGVGSRLTGDPGVDVAALVKNLTYMLVDEKARQKRAAQARDLGKELYRTARGGVLDVVRATLRRAASL